MRESFSREAKRKKKRGETTIKNHNHWALATTSGSFEACSSSGVKFPAKTKTGWLMSPGWSLVKPVRQPRWSCRECLGGRWR